MGKLSFQVAFGAFISLHEVLSVCSYLKALRSCGKVLEAFIDKQLTSVIASEAPAVPA